MKTQLNLNKVETIMKTADGADVIEKPAVYLTAMATEMFIKQVVEAACKNAHANKSKKLQYEDLVYAVHNTEKYTFLEYMIPKKITVREYKALLAKKQKQQSAASDEESSGGGSADSSGEE